MSTVSGLDAIADSRSFVTWDFNRDGWQDIALVNANSPLLEVYRNDIGQLATTSDATSGNYVALRFVGGNHKPTPSDQWSCRDGYGAMVTVNANENILKRELRCGEGFAAQNSNTLLIGIGDCKLVESIAVRWPSGRRQTITDVVAGMLVVVYENPEHSPNHNTFVQTPYQQPRPVVSNPLASPPRDLLQGFKDIASSNEPRARLTLYVSMATWCADCKREQPQIAHLRQSFSSGELAIYGVPVDGNDTEQKLREYIGAQTPPYRLLTGLRPEQREAFQSAIKRSLQTVALPSTIVTNISGQILMASEGVPTTSEIAKILQGNN